MAQASKTKTKKTAASKSAVPKRASRKGTKGAKNLVVVESPAKARTIENILGDDYRVIASVGHVRDLPAYGYGLEDFETFKPKYVVIKNKKNGVDKSDVVNEIAEAAAIAENVYLSTDPDREGEAISWHIVEASNIPADKISRVVFHEITAPAIAEAFSHPGELDMNLVDAQQTRRVLDRLIGFPLTWFVQGKVTRSASAGRVQSVALRLIVTREREILAFTPEEFWTIDALLAKDGKHLEAALVNLPGEKGKPTISDETVANRLVDAFNRSAFTVSSVKKSTRRNAPRAPFTTSTYQQAANNSLGIGAQRAMSLAQQLYEGIDLPAEGPVGLITYMRTDSVNVSAVAQNETRQFISKKWTAEHVPEKPRTFKTRSKGAQEAHEAIRPTSPGRTPESLKDVLTAEQLKAYRLIWERFLASQMSDAQYNTVTVEFEAAENGTRRGTFRANARSLTFAGHLAVHDSRNDEEINSDEESVVAELPELNEGDLLERRNVKADQHFTEPPPRYTEASLVRSLEEQGIGRPSTYAAIVQTVQRREYVKKEGRALVPQELGFIVNDLLVEHMDKYVDAPFTSELEQELDEIANGDLDYLTVVKSFWEPFNKDLEIAKENAKKAEEQTDIVCNVCNEANMVIKWSKTGKFMACPRYPDCKNAMPVTAEGDPVYVDAPTATDYPCPKCGRVTVQKTGPYGPYIDCEGREDETCDFRAGVPVGVVCPEEPDSGQLVEKTTRRGKFYACWNYPTCSYTSNSLEPGKMSPARPEKERAAANAKLLERSARGKKAAATRKANRSRTGAKAK